MMGCRGQRVLPVTRDHKAQQVRMALMACKEQLVHRGQQV